MIRAIGGALVAAALLAAPGVAQAPAKAAEWKPEAFELSNGLKVVILPDHRAPVVTHMLWYRVGSADEEKGKSGLAHFLEHLMFKATDKIPAGEYSKIVARNGGQINAATYYDFTNYHFRVAKDRLEQMMEMEADRMVNLRLTEEEVASELRVVQEERRQNVDSNPGQLLNEKVFAALYPGHPYGVPVIGHMSEVAKLSREDAVDWYRRWYGPENAILVVAGDTTAAELKPLADAVYGGIPKRGDLAARQWPGVKPLARSMKLTHADSKVRQPEWSRHWMGVAMGDPDADALQVGMEILGGGRTSRLYRELVEKGVAVSIHAYSMELEAPGMLSVGASPMMGVSLDKLEEAVLSVTDQFLQEGPTQQELDRAKRMIVASEIFARDNQMRMANWYGQMLTAGLSLDYIESWDERIKAVTAGQVLAAMKKRMTGVHHVDATLLPGGR